MPPSRGKPSGSAANQPAGFGELDFSEFEHYVEQMIGADSAEDREANASVLYRMCDALPQPEWGQHFGSAVLRFQLFGDDPNAVRDALLKLVMVHAGYMAVAPIRAKLEADKKRVDAANGTKGGRPSTGFDGQWYARYTELRGKRADLSPTAIYKHIARTWVSDDAETRGETRSWQAIRDGVKREQQRRAKPAGTPPLPT